MYLCRSSIESVQVTGFVIKRSENTFACIVSQHDQLRLKPDFDLLLNRGNGSKLEWKLWEKLIPFTQGFHGAISSGSRVSFLLTLCMRMFKRINFFYSLKFTMSLVIKSTIPSGTMISTMQLVSL